MNINEMRDIIRLCCEDPDKEEECLSALSNCLLYLPIDQYCILCNELKKIMNK